MSLKTSLLSALMLGAAASLAMAQPAKTPAKTSSTKAGPTLTDEKGMTLYTFDRDQDGKSACNDKCAENWPPLTAPSSAKPSGDWTLIKRDDGKMQWAYKGKPLYTWAKDQKPGDVTGDGVNKVWHVAHP